MSDAERQAVQDRLRVAQSAGQLDIHEFDERVQSAWASRTRGELERVVADLPVPPVPLPSAYQPVRRPARQVFSDTGGGTAMRVLTIIWLSVVVVNLMVWGLVSITSADDVYPWFIWLAPSGAALAVLYLAGIGRPRRG